MKVKYLRLDGYMAAKEVPFSESREIGTSAAMVLLP